LCACFVAVPITWMSFAFGVRELRGDVLIMPETHIVMSFLIFCLALWLALLLVPHLSFAHGPNHCSYGFGSRENRFEPRRFGYGPRPHRGDRFPCMPVFPAGGSHTHFEPRHLESPRFPYRGSRPTWSSDVVQRVVKISSGPMVKCWITKIYLTNPSTEPSTFSRSL
jgi:hypothetical protein